MSSRRVPNRKDRVCMNMIRVYRTARSAPGSREQPIFSIGWIGWISQPKRPKSDGTDLRHWSRLKQMEAFLPPIEKPQGLIMKFVYTMTRRQFGKVITPLNVHSARLPLAFDLFYTKIPKLDQELLLPPETALLLREQVARINLGLFCAALDYVTELTKNKKGPRKLLLACPASIPHARSARLSGLLPANIFTI